jgi:hypothetical protein
MARTFTADDFVSLPRNLSVPAALALGAALESAAEAADPLPAPLAKARQKLSGAYLPLKTAATAPGRGPDTPYGPEVNAADLALDGCWSALHGLASAWLRLPLAESDPARMAARQVLELLFPDGLRFTQLAFALEWAESERRLERMSVEKLEEPLRLLGAERFVRALREAHEHYGKLLGITKAKAEAKPEGSLLPLLQGFASALRSYVLKVSAHVDDDDESSRELAAKLLAPLASWRTPPAKGRKADEPAGDEGGDPSATD